MTTAERDFSKLHFSSPAMPDRQWLEWFRDEFGRQLYRLDIEPRPDVPFKLEATTRLLPDLAMAHSVRSPMRTVHRGVGDDEIGLVVVLEGQSVVQVENRTHELTAGMGGMGRTGVSATIDVPAGMRLLSFRLRRRLMEPLIKGFGDFATLRDSQAMRLLLSYVRMIEAEDTISSADLRQLVTMHVHDLAALAFGATREAEEVIESRGGRAGRLAALKQDILCNLADPGLGVAEVALRQGVTPRYVHKLFEAEGSTFSEFVVGKRLQRAHRMLLDPRFEGHSISAVALAVGFGDLSYFNRTFRRRFGTTPSDERKLKP